MARVTVTRAGGDRGPYARTDTLNLTYGPIGLAQPDLNGTAVQGGQGIDVRQRADATLAPLIVYVLGGGWETSSGASSGGSTAFTALLNEATSMGYGFISMDYRQAGTNEGAARNNTIADELADVLLALDWIRKNAGTYNLDLARLVLIGGSAGAQLSLMALLKGASGLRPKLWIGLSGPYQLDFNGTPANSVGPPYLHNVTFASSFATPAAAQGSTNDWDLLSPTYLINGSPSRSNYPPIALPPLPYLHLIHGDSDLTVPVFCSRQLDSACTAKGIAHTYDEIVGADHASISWAQFYPKMWPMIRSKLGANRGTATRSVVSGRVAA